MDKLKSQIKSQGNHISAGTYGQWIALALCALVVASAALEPLFHKLHGYAKNFTPGLIPFIAAILSSAGIIRFDSHTPWFRVQRTLLWSGILLMIWAANGLPFDLMRMTGLMPQGIDWPGLVTRTLALAAVIALVRIALALPANSEYTHQATWYGYAAFVLAMPYPVLRTWWAFGGTPGLMWPGAAGQGFAPLLFAIPWVMAAVLSLLLVPSRSILPRRLLLTAGWTATAIVAMIGPTACWLLVTGLVKGGIQLPEGMAIWIPCLFYSSWFLWAIAAGAATRSYQLRSAGSASSPV